MDSEHGNLLARCKGFLILLALLLGALPPAFAGSRKIAKELEGTDPSKSVDVIVRFKQAPTAELHNKVLRHGGALKRELRIVRGGAYTVPASALAELAADSSVEYIAPNRPLHSTRTIRESGRTIFTRLGACAGGVGAGRGRDRCEHRDHRQRYRR